MQEFKFTELATLRDLVNAIPDILDMPIALVGREGLYEFIGEPNLEGRVAKVFVEEYSFEANEDRTDEAIPVLVFATEHAHRDWNI